MRRTVFLTRLAKKNYRLTCFNVKNTTAIINRKIIRVKKRFNKKPLKWKYYSYRNKTRRFYLRRFIKKKKKVKLDRRKFKKPNLKRFYSFKVLLFINSSLFSSINSKIVHKPVPLYAFKVVKSLISSNPVQLALRKKFLYLNALSFLIKKKFNLKNNRSFFYSVHVASPQKKIKK